jgi:O-antigen/teichoic acid export membrane protein
MTTQSRFFGNTVALVVATVLATALTLAQMKILAAHLSLAVFGLFASLRGLSLLVSMLAANGFPQLLVRYLPELAARHARAAAGRLNALAIGATLAGCAVLLAIVVGFSGVFFRHMPVEDASGAFLVWFAVTTVAIALKLIVYGGFNGLRRFSSQTVFETLSLMAQVGWMALEADHLTLTRLFEILGVTSMATVLLAAPWLWLSTRRDVTPGDGSPVPAWRSYWLGATGLSVVALAFTDVDRWVLSNVLALESLSLFHVASRVSRLANRFIAIPVLAFQPEATRVHAEGRTQALKVSSSAFFKASVILAVFAAAAIAVYALPLISIASNREFYGARPTLLLLAAGIPLTAAAAPLTAIMKALDAVRSALYCDLAWAGVYVISLLLLAGPMGVEGAGLAQLLACAVQLVVAFRLATLRPTVATALAVLVRTLACVVVVFVPIVLLGRSEVPWGATMVLAIPAAWGYTRLLRWSGVLTAEERERLLQVAGRNARRVRAWMP